MPRSIRPPLIESRVDIIFAVSAGLRNAVQMTMWPSRTRDVCEASAASEVNDSNVISSVGRGTVWKWSNSQIDSKPSSSACFATLSVRRHASRESQPSYSPCQPWGTITPSFMSLLELPADRSTMRLMQGERQRRDSDAAGGRMRPAAFCVGSGHLVVHGNDAFLKTFGARSVGMPLREAAVDLPPGAFEVLDAVLAQRRPLARWIEIRGEPWRLTAAPRVAPETAEVYGVRVHLRERSDQPILDEPSTR